jgi:hypothetical protein
VIFNSIFAIVALTMSVLTICEPILAIDQFRSSDAQIVSPIREAMTFPSSPQTLRVPDSDCTSVRRSTGQTLAEVQTSQPAPKLESLSYVELLYSSPNRLVVRHRHVEAATSIK